MPWLDYMCRFQLEFFPRDGLGELGGGEHFVSLHSDTTACAWPCDALAVQASIR